MALSISAFYFRYISLPEPVRGEALLTSYLCVLIIAMPQKTFKRYWDFSIPSAEVKPTQISKVSDPLTWSQVSVASVREVMRPLLKSTTGHQYNTFLQLVLMGVTTVSPLSPYDIALPLQALQ